MSRKLLFVVNTDSFFMSHRLSIALAALKEGYEVHVATEPSNCIDEMHSLGLRVHPLSLDRRSAGAFSNGRTFFQILLLFVKLRPDVVHLITVKPVLLGGVAARFAAVPCVVVAISGLGFIFISQGIKARMRRWLAGWLYRLALGHQYLTAIFQNEDDREILFKLSRLTMDKTLLIRGSGVDLSFYYPSPLPEGQPVVVLAARLLADKGVREFVEAARILKNDGNAARFILVGDSDPGNPATISNNQLKQWVSEEVIEWWGYRHNIKQIFASATMVVLPSYREGLPKVLIEAAACGRAVITTDVPGCRDAIEPGITGLLVPVRDSAVLAAAIKRLLDNRLLCAKMGLAGRKLAERSFDVRHVAEQHLRVYNKLIQRVT